jgi:glucokinase
MLGFGVVPGKSRILMADGEVNDALWIGVDLGGTKILAGVFDDKMQLLSSSKLSTKALRGYDSVVERISRCVRDAADEGDFSLKQVRGIGIGAPGSIRPETGEVIFAPNLKWRDVPLKRDLEKYLGIPVFVENDCTVCTIGVHRVEFGGKPRNLIGIFLGTGIGGGLILNGELYSGSNRTAGEVGHMVLQVGGARCGCGNRGCFEALASRSAIFRRLEQEAKDGAKTLLTDFVKEGGRISELKSGDLKKALRRGDKLVERVIEDAAEYTGIAVANLMNVFNPELVVLGGGVMDALEDQMLAIIIETARDYAMPGTTKNVDIVASKLGDNAGITGAAVLARQGVCPGT